MVEALRNRNEQLEELVSEIRSLKEYWLNPSNQDSLKSITLSTSNSGIPRLRGYVEEEKPKDILSLRYEAFVGIAFFENEIVAEIHYPFYNGTITSFTCVDLDSRIITGFDLKDDKFPGIPIQYQALDTFEQLKKLTEFADYFKRLTSFAVPYEDKYLDDVKNLNKPEGQFWEIFSISPYVFETEVFK